MLPVDRLSLFFVMFLCKCADLHIHSIFVHLLASQIVLSTPHESLCSAGRLAPLTRPGNRTVALLERLDDLEQC
jgi:hypothetical protein